MRGVEYPITTLKNRLDRLGKVTINQTQHFTAAPETAWRFHIGGYQPAHEWLKDRNNRKPTHEALIHYQRTRKSSSLWLKPRG